MNQRADRPGAALEGYARYLFLLELSHLFGPQIAVPAPNATPSVVNVMPRRVSSVATRSRSGPDPATAKRPKAGKLAAMRKTGACPKCGGGKLFQISRVEQTYCDAGGSLRSFDVTAAIVNTGKKGVFGEKTELVVAGPYEAMVCAGCGFAEWYASAAALWTLARMADGQTQVRLLDRDAAKR